MEKRLTYCIYINVILLFALAFYFFFYPAAVIIYGLNDPGLPSGAIPRLVYDWHRSLSAKYEKWARARVESGKAAGLSVYDISGTEWPVFGTIFYLSATESLQEAWEEDPSTSPTAPKDYAREAIEASAALVSDPNHAGWVRRHWGDDYLERENLFYRMLLISGLTSYQKLTGNDQYESLLREQVETLSQEIDSSPYGILDDYPGQAYPVDVLPAIAAIRRADKVLGTDHSEFVERAVRAFQGDAVDQSVGLPAFRADSRTGQAYGPARGSGTSFALTWAPLLWPETAEEWYARYDRYFWQREWATAGFREFSNISHYSDWLMDVDSGPVIAGYGTSASAFGIGAARTYGHFDQAYPLSVEALAAAWPLPDGTLLGPRMFSNLSDAPYVGETGLLFSLTRRPLVEATVPSDGYVPASVYFGILFYAFWGGLLTWRAFGLLRRWQKSVGNPIPQPNLQLFLWGALFIAGLIMLFFSNKLVGILLLLLAQNFPSRSRVWSWLIDYEYQ
ncbi:MAG: hypothetical protein AB1649_14270 [Chloroflexota bacterium]